MMQIDFNFHDDLRGLLRPSQTYAHPMDVVRDRALDIQEKRAVLASWASDACSVPDAPHLRSCCGHTVSWDEIMDALRLLDRVARWRGLFSESKHWKGERSKGGSSGGDSFAP
jgi:hypothetical protein